MAASSSSASFFDAQNQIQSSSAAPFPDPPPPPQQKKKRNQPRTPNSDVEVINLSPKTLMATNRFVCEVCKKGFQREQNLQLHRRGHNLPWKLKQKSHTEMAKRKVYVCPEPSCVHHDASRALGDLTGIKKHYYRKHGEKRWKCEKCSKRYAVQSDWKAHSKTCGTKEYRCDCGTLFSRRDSFITHRAFCDALAQETARHPPPMLSLPRHHHHHPYGSPSTGPNMILPGGLAHIPTTTPHTTPHMDFFTHAAATAAAAPDNNFTAAAATSAAAGGGGLFMQEQDHHHHQDHYNLDFLPAAAADGSNAAMGNMVISSLFEAGNSSSTAAALSGGADNRISSSTAAASLFGHSMQSAAGSATHHMSATALLQKAAQMGSSASAAEVFGEHGNSLQELMNSFSAGGGSRQAEEQNMTRDFLGVGQIVRTMSTRGGFMNQRRELQQSGDGNDVVTNSSSHPRF